MNGARLLVLSLLALPLAACRSNRSAPEREPIHADESFWAPDWRGEPLSWTKLGKIETWLVGPGPAHFADEVPAAELELAEGRLELARKDGASLDKRTLQARLASAEAGFRRVLALADATPLQHGRAETGLKSVVELRSGGAPKPAAEPAVLAQVLPRSKWGAAAAVPARLTPNRQPWRRITVHHSSTPTSEIGGTSVEASADAIRRIQQFHMRERAYGDIGYHFLIDPEGRIFQGRALEWQGAHAEGANNVANIGICLLGDFIHERPDPRALRSLEQLVQALSKKNSIPATAVKGHEQLKPTDCPGPYLMDWVRRYAAGDIAVASSANRAPGSPAPGAARLR